MSLPWRWSSPRWSRRAGDSQRMSSYARLVLRARDRLCGHTVLVPLPVGLHADGTPALRLQRGVVTTVSSDGSVGVRFDDGREQHFGVTFALEQFRVLSA